MMKRRTRSIYQLTALALCIVAQLAGSLFSTQASPPLSNPGPTVLAQAGSWQYTGTTQWNIRQGPSAPGDGSIGIRIFQFDERGGDVEATIRGASNLCPQGETEVIRFKWTFNASILSLRPRDLIPVTVVTSVVKSQSCPNFAAGRSTVYVTGSDGQLLPEDQRNYYYQGFPFYPADPVPAGVRFNFEPGIPESSQGRSALQATERTPPPNEPKRAFFAIHFATRATRGAGEIVAFAYTYAFGGSAPAMFYEHISFNGASFSAAADIPFVGWEWNDRISSVRVPPGKTVVLYEHSNYGGQSLRLNGDVPDLRQFPGPGPDRTWNDAVSSIRLSAATSSGN